MLRVGRSERRPRWWLNPKWWIVPALAFAALVLTPVVHDARFEGSRSELTAFAEQQLAIPLNGDGTGRCDHLNPPVEVGTYRITFSCVSEQQGRFRLAVGMHFDDSSEYELDYGDDTITGTRLWQKHGTHS